MIINIKQIIKGPIEFTKLYKGTVLIWQKVKDIISSCFGSGKRIGNQKWSGNDKWKAN